MGRRNETNRLAHKKKVDQKKNKASNAEALRRKIKADSATIQPAKQPRFTTRIT